MIAAYGGTQIKSGIGRADLGEALVFYVIDFWNLLTPREAVESVDSSLSFDLHMGLSTCKETARLVGSGVATVNILNI